MHETHEHTGATEKQVEAAVVAYLCDLAGVEEGVPESVIDTMKVLFTNASQYLVPPGTVIVPEAVLKAVDALLIDYEIGLSIEERMRDLAGERDAMSDTRELTPLEEVMESVTARARALEAVVAAAQEVVAWVPADLVIEGMVPAGFVNALEDLALQLDAVKQR